MFFLIPLSKRKNLLRETLHDDSDAKAVYLSFKHRITINYDSSGGMKVRDQSLFVKIFFCPGVFHDVIWSLKGGTWS